MQFETLETRNLMSATLTAAAAVQTIDAAPTLNVSLNATRSAGYGLNAEEKRVVEQMTSTFENSTTTIDYVYCENIGDGRGYTAGRAGFCTGTGDFYEVVKRYTAEKPGNPLAKFLPRLKQLADQYAAGGWDEPAGSTSGLSGIAAAWRTAAQDPAFRAAQDSLVDEWYYAPAMDRAQELGLTHALSKGQLYDAGIQHGQGDDNDGLGEMIAETNALAGGTPAQGVSEAVWLQHFIDVRMYTLTHAENESTAEAWADSVSRVEVYQTLLTAGNLDLTGATITFTVYGDTFTIAGAGPATTTTTPAGTGRISGLVFSDPDRDGDKTDEYSYGHQGRVVFIDADNDQYCDEDEVRTTTDADGRYTFENLAAGTYNVRLDSTGWWFSTTPIMKQTTVAAGQSVTDVDFGEWVTYRGGR